MILYCNNRLYLNASISTGYEPDTLITAQYNVTVCSYLANLSQATMPSDRKLNIAPLNEKNWRIWSCRFEAAAIEEKLVVP
jgi:hypothetical protein